MRSSLSTQILAVVIVVALAAVFAAPARAAGTPDVAPGGVFAWLSHSVSDWVSTLFGVDISHAGASTDSSGVRSMTGKIRVTSEPDGSSQLSSEPTTTPTLTSDGST